MGNAGHMLAQFNFNSSIWFQVKIDVRINEWFGEFYDLIQKALRPPNSITISEYGASLLSL